MVVNTTRHRATNHKNSKNGFGLSPLVAAWKTPAFPDVTSSPEQVISRVNTGRNVVRPVGRLLNGSETTNGWVCGLACVAGLPAVAHAQSAIAGVVKDTSGAVLPGVTVEASSDVLIEKTRSVITDGEGAYRIVDLPPWQMQHHVHTAGFLHVQA